MLGSQVQCVFHAHQAACRVAHHLRAASSRTVTASATTHARLPDAMRYSCTPGRPPCRAPPERGLGAHTWLGLGLRTAEWLLRSMLGFQASCARLGMHVEGSCPDLDLSRGQAQGKRTVNAHAPALADSALPCAQAARHAHQLVPRGWGVPSFLARIHPFPRMASLLPNLQLPIPSPLRIPNNQACSR